MRKNRQIIYREKKNRPTTFEINNKEIIITIARLDDTEKIKDFIENFISKKSLVIRRNEIEVKGTIQFAKINGKCQVNFKDEHSKKLFLAFLNSRV